MQNHSVTYSNLLRRDGPVIMGIVLYPLSLGHLIHLNAEKCAIISERLTVNKDNIPYVMDELSKALLICSLTFEQYSELQYQPEVRKQIYKRWDRVIKVLCKKGLFNLMDSLDDFYIYLEKGCKDIPHTVPPSETMPATTFDENSWYVPMLHDLCEKFSAQESVILNQPFQKTQFDYYYHAAKNGALTFKSKEDLELLHLNLHGGKP